MSERVTHALDYARTGGMGWDHPTTRESLTVLADEVERLQQWGQAGWDVHNEHVETMNRQLLHEQAVRDDAIERATKAERVIADVREVCTGNFLLRGGNRAMLGGAITGLEGAGSIHQKHSDEMQDWLDDPEQQERLEAILGDLGRDTWDQVPDSAAALLPDETGDDRG